MWFKEFHGIHTPEENLKDAAEGEHEEWTSMYKRMAEEAREEGFAELAEKFELVAEIEAAHEKRYLKLLDSLKKGETFMRSAVGMEMQQLRIYSHGDEALEVWSACAHPQAYFERKTENY